MLFFTTDLPLALGILQFTGQGSTYPRCYVTGGDTTVHRAGQQEFNVTTTQLGASEAALPGKLSGWLPNGYLFSYLSTYGLTEWVTKVKPDINSSEVHPQVLVWYSLY